MIRQLSTSFMFQRKFFSHLDVINFAFARNVNRIRQKVEKIQQKQVAVLKNINEANSQNNKQTERTKIDYSRQNNKIVYSFQNLEQDFKTYQNFLQIHNKHQKKAHIKISTNQLKLIQKAIQQDRLELIVKFLQNNKSNRIANQLSMELIINYFQSKWSKMSQEQRRRVTQKLILHGEFDLFQNYIPTQLNVKKLQKLSSSQRDAKLQIFISSQLNSLTKINQKMQFFYNCLLYFKHLPQNLLKLQQLQEDPNFQKNKLQFLRQYLSKEKLQTNNKSKNTHVSLIEQNILCLLKSLNYNFKCQVNINKYTVDFLLQPIASSNSSLKKQIKIQPKQIVLQVFGNYHFTTRNKLRPNDIKKIILLQKDYIVRVVYHQSFSKTNGFVNKRALLKKIIQQDKEVNWEPQYEGYNSKWQLDSEYSQFK